MYVLRIDVHIVDKLSVRRGCWNKLLKLPHVLVLMLLLIGGKRGGGHTCHFSVLSSLVQGIAGTPEGEMTTSAYRERSPSTGRTFMLSVPNIVLFFLISFSDDRMAHISASVWFVYICVKMMINKYLHKKQINK